MTKDKFRDAGKEQDNKAKTTQKGTATTQAQAPRPAPPAPSLTPKPPFGMPRMPVARSVNVITPPPVQPGKDDPEEA